MLTGSTAGALSCDSLLVMSSSSLSRRSRNSPTRRSDQICHFFAKGTCLRGISCPYSHCSEDQDGTVDREGSKLSETLIPSQATGNHQLTSVATSEPAKSPSSQEKLVRPCSAFERNGKCRYGDRCRYSHSISQTLDTKPAVKRQRVKSVPSSNEEKKEKMKPCRYFQAGNCKSRDKCKFLHTPAATATKGPKEKETPVQSEKSTSEPMVAQSKAKVPKGKTQKMCRYFRAGHCNAGDKCKFVHQAKSSQPDDLNTNTTAQPARLVVRGISEYAVDSLSDESAAKIRSSEITTLLKRFPRTREEDGMYAFTLTASDPDWPYDVNHLRIALKFPDAYPKERMECTVLPDDRVPEIVRRSIAKGIAAWICERYEKMQTKGKAETVFRPFVRWLDKSMEELFTDGLKKYQKQLIAEASGVQFITAEDIQEKFAQQKNSSDEEVVDEDQQAEENSEEEKENTDVPKQHVNASFDPNKRGTEIKLLNLQLKESAATLSATNIALIVQCTRCKNNSDLKTPPNRTNSLQCPKCHTTLLITFRGALVHQMNAIIGYLDLVECRAFDLLLSESSFSVGCMACSKDMPIQGLLPGRPNDTWCRQCHQKIRIAVENARFLALQPSQPSNASNTHTVHLKAVKKIQKDPAIQLGQPLPDKGICKHYKKSFRWFRFPCCGKTYPCDICHDENETDHEMKYANRMICGFCCKEQPYSATKPCSGCESAMTKQNSSHWEGGKGCRDKIKMARTDAKKYLGSCKTTSRVAQRNESQGKKNTKIRHA